MADKLVNIYPCVDSLLYAPIYMAIESYAHRGHRALRPEESPDGKYTEWNFVNDGYHIRLHRPAGGDVLNYDRLKKHTNSEDEVHVAIGDPAEALRRDAEFGNPSNPELTRSYRVLGNFVNRIALWGICRKNIISGDATRSQLSQRQLNQVIKDGQSGMAPLYVRQGSFDKLRLGYSNLGTTTAAVMNLFASAGFSEPDEPPKNMGVDEIMGIINNHYDLTFSYAPWLARALLAEKQIDEEYAIVPWFQAVPYPFSAITIFANDIEETKAFHLLVEFVQHVTVGLAFLYRYKKSAKALLKQNMLTHSYYGLNESVSDEIREDMIREAFSRLVLTDAYCESLESTWVAWDLAIEAATNGNSDVSLKTKLFDKVRRLEKRSYIVDAATKEFSETTFRSILGRMVKSAKQEIFRDWEQLGVQQPH